MEQTYQETVCEACGIGFDPDPEVIRDGLCHKCGRELAERRVEEAQGRRRAALETISLIAAEIGVTLPTVEDEPYPCNRIARLCGAAQTQTRAAQEELRALTAKMNRCDLDDFRHQRALIEAAKRASGDLAERVALDMDHDNRDHSAWYRAVKRLRREVERINRGPACST